MIKAAYSVLIVTLCLFLTPGLAAGQEAFSFYGLTFGMTRAEAEMVFPLHTNNMAKEPEHGMASLELSFDRENLLMAISASYSRPEVRLESTGLKRALREKFAAPVRGNHPEISVTIDEHANRAAIVITFQSNGIKEQNIEYYKGEFLKMME
jgi:hypothetical protein